jgi:hypothetical protein
MFGADTKRIGRGVRLGGHRAVRSNKKIKAEDCFMKLRNVGIGLSIFVLGMMISMPAIADEQDKKADKKASGQPSEADMMAMMMQMAQPGENHKLLAHSVGNWSLKVKMWNNGDTNAAPMESSATAKVKEILGGRFFASEVSGKMEMPGPDGKMTETEFKGTGIEGYDNARKKFVGSWVDNMSTGILMAEGDYDAATKTFTFHAEVAYRPGVKARIRETVKIVDNDHHTFEWFEDRGAGEVKTMQIEYTRTK